MDAEVSQPVALVLPWHLVLIFPGTMKGAVPGEMGDGDVADGELGKDGEVGPLSCAECSPSPSPGLG